MHTQRTIGLILAGCVVVALAALAGLVLWLGAARGIITAVALAAAVAALYVFVIGPWQRQWGAGPVIARAPMPGDDLLRADAPSTTRAIEIDAPPDRVFPWLRQIGLGRGGWYSYDWIDNDGRRSIDRIDPALQVLSVGDRIEMLPGFGPVVREIVPEHHVLSGGDNDTWCLLIQALPDGRSRLLSRWRQDWPKTLGTRVWTMVCDPGAFVMEQKMLRTIRDLSEKHVPAATRITNAPTKMERTSGLGGLPGSV